MSEVWDDRKRALEEDYFRKKEQEAIEKMRQQRDAEAARAAALKCPKCDGALAEMKIEDIIVDRCESCHGIWLDAGELEHLTAKETSDGWFSRMLQSFTSK